MQIMFHISLACWKMRFMISNSVQNVLFDTNIWTQSYALLHLSHCFLNPFDKYVKLFLFHRLKHITTLSHKISFKRQFIRISLIYSVEQMSILSFSYEISSCLVSRHRFLNFSLRQIILVNWGEIFPNDTVGCIDLVDKKHRVIIFSKRVPITIFSLRNFSFHQP